MNDFKYEAIPSYPEMGSHAISNCNGVFFGDVELNHAHSHLDSVDSNESINIENRKKYLFHIVIEQYLNLNFQRFMMIVCCLCSIPCFLYVYVNYEIFSQWFTMSNVTTYDVYVIRHADQKYITPYKCDPVQSPKLPDKYGKCEDFGDNMCGGDYLTNEGLRRAKCIADNIDFNQRLKYILAQNPGSCSNHTHIKREYQTVLPMAMKYNLPINIDLNHEDNQPAADIVKSTNIRQLLCHATHSWFWNSNSIPNSMVISWTHSQMPILFHKLGCSEEKYGDICTKKLGFLEFDTYYKMSLSCQTSEILSVIRLKENCNEYTYANTGSNVTHGY